MALTRPGSGRGRGRGGEQGQRRARRKSAVLLFAFFPCVALYRTKKRRKENFLPARQRPSPPRRPSGHLGRTLARSLKTLARRERAEKRRKSAERAIESRESACFAEGHRKHRLPKRRRSASSSSSLARSLAPLSCTSFQTKPPPRSREHDDLFTNLGVEGEEEEKKGCVRVRGEAKKKSRGGKEEVVRESATKQWGRRSDFFFFRPPLLFTLLEKKKKKKKANFRCLPSRASFYP